MNPLWYAQVRGILRLELKKTLFDPPPELETAAGTSVLFAVIFEFVLRFVVYFGCVWIFMNLFRGEVLDRSLHYYFLSPIRREVLVAGKYLSAFAATSAVFIGSTLLSMAILFSYAGVGSAASYLLGGPGFGQALSYVGIVILGCLGYGAVFLVIGLFVRNPIVPAVAIFLWESLNPLLPALLKKISVIFYLESLRPIPLSDGPFAVIAEPVPVWLGIPGLILFTAVTLVIAGLRIRRMEIAYASD
jgi:ABC-type transport system involved in multi-copper enzyme maturation permease subunit